MAAHEISEVRGLLQSAKQITNQAIRDGELIRSASLADQFERFASYGLAGKRFLG
jgi:hypothetical protein